MAVLSNQTNHLSVILDSTLVSNEYVRAKTKDVIKKIIPASL